MKKCGPEGRPLVRRRITAAPPTPDHSPAQRRINCFLSASRRPHHRDRPAFILAVCDFRHGRLLYNSLDSGEAMAERDLTAREDRFLGLCLAAAAVIVVFIFIVSS